MRFAVAAIVVLTGCISSPSVSLVDSPDAATPAGDTPDAGTSDDAAATTTSGDGATAVTPDPPSPCDGRCAAAGGSCAGDICNISCPGSPLCTSGDIVCPAGMPCKVTCTGKEACAHDVRCVEATDCEITCDGDSACHDHVICSGPSCEITCVNKGCAPDRVRCCASSCTFNGIPLTCP